MYHPFYQVQPSDLPKSAIPSQFTVRPSHPFKLEEDTIDITVHFILARLAVLYSIFPHQCNFSSTEHSFCRSRRLCGITFRSFGMFRTFLLPNSSLFSLFRIHRSRSSRPLLSQSQVHVVRGEIMTGTRRQYATL